MIEGMLNIVNITALGGWRLEIKDWGVDGRGAGAAPDAHQSNIQSPGEYLTL
jgi:hypothetical protein